MVKTLDQQIAETEARLARLRQKERSKDTRRKIIVGSVIISEALDRPDTARMLVDLIQRRVNRDVDKTDISPLLETLKKAAFPEAS